MSLEELIEKAREVNVLDSWNRSDDGSLVFELASATVRVNEEEARPFVRGLLRGYESAKRLRDEDDRR